MFVMNLVVHLYSKNNLIESWASAEIFVMGGGASPKKAPNKDGKGPPHGKKSSKKSSNGEKGPNKEKKSKKAPNIEKSTVFDFTEGRAPALAPPPPLRAPIYGILDY